MGTINEIPVEHNQCVVLNESEGRPTIVVASVTVPTAFVPVNTSVFHVVKLVTDTSFLVSVTGSVGTGVPGATGFTVYPINFNLTGADTTAIGTVDKIFEVIAIDVGAVQHVAAAGIIRMSTPKLGP